MANPPKPQASQSTKAPRVKRTGAELLAHNKAKLQEKLNQVTQMVADNPTVSLAVYARRAIKSGLPAETAAKMIAAVKSAVTEMENVVERSYAAPQEREPVKSRVTL